MENTNRDDSRSGVYGCIAHEDNSEGNDDENLLKQHHF